MRIVFLTYGNDMYFHAKHRIVKEAALTGWFDECHALGPEDLSQSFRTQFRDILDYPRGAGYWIWKFDILQQMLDKLDENDLVVYCDAGCTVNRRGEKRFRQYCRDLLKSEYGMIAFQMNAQPELRWTPRELFELLHMAPQDNTGHYVGGILLIKKCQHTQTILDAAMRILAENPYIITDRGYDASQQDTEFRENRHDQSILSLLRKKYGAVVYPDETYCETQPPFRPEFPFWATRWRQAESLVKEKQTAR